MRVVVSRGVDASARQWVRAVNGEPLDDEAGESRFKGFGGNRRRRIKASWRRQAARRQGLIAATGGTRVGSECSALLRSAAWNLPER